MKNSITRNNWKTKLSVFCSNSSNKNKDKRHENEKKSNLSEKNPKLDIQKNWKNAKKKNSNSIITTKKKSPLFWLIDNKKKNK